MIKHIEIRNFRSIREVSVDLEPLTVLIGRSGAGKSNFVQAIRSLRTILLHRGQLAQRPDGTLLNSAPAVGEAGPLGYRVVLSVAGFRPELDYSATFSNRQVMPGALIEERLKAGSEVIFHHRQKKWEVPPSVHPLPAPGNLTLGSLNGVRPATIAYVALTTGLGIYDFPGSVLQPPASSGDGTGFTDKGETYLATAAGIINNLDRIEDWASIAAALQSLGKGIRGVDLHLPQLDRLDVAHAIGEKLLLLNAADESEGFRRFLAHLLALYQTPPKQTILFEHPENGIHPGAMTALFEEFEGHVKSGRGQIILTTHSPQLLNHFKAEHIRVVDIENQQTRIDVLAPEQRESVEERLLYPGELLTVDPARLPGQLDEVPG